MDESRGLERRSSGGPWEDVVGYSRVVRSGELAWVAGCTAVVDGAIVGEGDAYRQTLEAFDVARTALESVGMRLSDAVRTRMYVVDRSAADEVGRAHSELFDAIRPVSTMVVVAGLIDPRLLVEIEIDACRPRTAHLLEGSEPANDSRS